MKQTIAKAMTIYFEMFNSDKCLPSHADVYKVIQGVFHVYLNKFKNAITHLFLVIFGNSQILWVRMIIRNMQLSKNLSLIFIFWFGTVFEDK